jgi:hypothetical protein
MRTTLEQMVASCRGDHSAHCVILDQLATPSAGTQHAPGAIRTRPALKEVRPGEKRPKATRPAARHDAASASGALALAAWTQSFARASAFS